MAIKKTFVKPQIKTKKLTLRSLLGENGWYGGNLSFKPVLARTYEPI